jgi:hypothetical protein
MFHLYNKSNDNHSSFKRVERQFFFQDEGDLDKVGDFDR